MDLRTIFNRADVQTLLLEDFLLERHGGKRLALNDLLIDLGTRLEYEGASLSQYGFPEPDCIDTELEREWSRNDKNEQAEYLASLQQATPNTDEQQIIFDYVLEALLPKGGHLYSYKTWEAVENLR